MAPPLCKTALIQRLPHEILLNIFFLVHLACNLRFEALYVLMRVCRRWKNSVCSTPGLWAAYIPCFPSEHLESAQRFLRLARNLPIGIRIYKATTMSSDEVTNAVSLALRLAPRLRELSIEWTQISGEEITLPIKSVFDHTLLFPAMKAVSVIAGPRLRLTGGVIDAPMLQTARFERTLCLPWLKRTGQLRSLTLVGVQLVYRDLFTRTLARAPHLQELALVNTDVTEALNELESQRIQLSLNNLKELRLTLPWHNLFRIFSSAQFPSMHTAFLTSSTAVWSQPPVLLDDDLHRMISLVNALENVLHQEPAADTARRTLGIDVRPCTISVYDCAQIPDTITHRNIQVNLDSLDSFDLRKERFTQICRTLLLSTRIGVQTRCLRIKDHNLGKRLWRDVIGKFNALDELHLECGPAITKDILNTLRREAESLATFVPPSKIVFLPKGICKCHVIGLSQLAAMRTNNLTTLTVMKKVLSVEQMDQLMRAGMRIEIVGEGMMKKSPTQMDASEKAAGDSANSFLRFLNGLIRPKML